MYFFLGKLRPLFLTDAPDREDLGWGEFFFGIFSARQDLGRENKTQGCLWHELLAIHLRTHVLSPLLLSTTPWPNRTVLNPWFLSWLPRMLSMGREGHFTGWKKTPPKILLWRFRTICLFVSAEPNGDKKGVIWWICPALLTTTVVPHHFWC